MAERSFFYGPPDEVIAKMDAERQALFTFKFYLDEKHRDLEDKITELGKQQMILIDQRSQVKENIEKIITMIIALNEKNTS